MDSGEKAERAEDGAGGGTRTPDLDFTKVLLYQLSYAGTAPVKRI